MSDLILRAEGLDRSFGGIHAVKDVSLEVPRGALHAIIGPNGSGKTTLFNLITGHTKPGRGRVEFDGHDITGMPYAKVARRGLAKSYQITTVFPLLTVFENVRIAAQAASHANVLAAGRQHQGGHPPHRRGARADRAGGSARGDRRQPLARRPAPPRPGDRAGHRAAPAAAGRADGRHEPDRDGGHGRAGPGAEPRRHDPDDRAQDGRDPEHRQHDHRAAPGREAVRGAPTR